MGNRSFTTRPAEVTEAFDINGKAFRLVASLPGDVLLDFLSQADEENPSTMAAALRSLFAAAVHPDDYESFSAFIRDPENNVTLDVLAEIAGYIAEKLSGAPKAPGLPG